MLPDRFLEHHELRLCIWSIQGRGSENTPGLYWGIVKKRGTKCPGKLLRFTDQNLFHKVLQWLDRRRTEHAAAGCNVGVASDAAETRTNMQARVVASQNYHRKILWKIENGARL